MSSGFTKRNYGTHPDDESALYYLWGKSYARSNYGRRVGAAKSASNEELAYWEEMRPIIDWHLAHCDVTFVCSAKDPGIVYALAITSGDVVHYVVMKHHVKQMGLSREVLTLLLGSRMERPCSFTSDLWELRKMDMLPRDWRRDEFWYLRNQLKARAA